MVTCKVTDGERFCTLVADHDKGPCATMHEQYGLPWESEAEAAELAASVGRAQADRQLRAAMRLAASEDRGADYSALKAEVRSVEAGQ